MVHNSEIIQISKLLLEDKVIICPTDTIWGLSCSVMSESATNRIYEIKKRRKDKPFILLVSDIEMLKRYVSNLHPRIETLLSYHKKPLTIVYSTPRFIPKYALANDGSIGIRIVKNDFCASIIRELRVPLVSTSANYSYQTTPSNFRNIDINLLKEVDYVSHYGREDDISNEPSVIIKYDEEGAIEILRP